MATMADVLRECLKHPARTSVWSHEEGRYVCSKDPEYAAAVTARDMDDREENPPIWGMFKIVVWAVIIGTGVFTVICIGVRLTLGEHIPTGTDALLKTLERMAYTGGGGIVGLLGAYALRIKGSKIHKSQQ